MKDPETSQTSSPTFIMATRRNDVTGMDSDLVNSTDENPFLRRRAKSIGPQVRRPNKSRQLRPPAAQSRENTPNPTVTPRSITPSSLPVPVSQRGTGSRTPTGTHRHVRSRSSLGSDSIREEESPQHKPHVMRRAESNEVLDGGTRGRALSSGQLGRGRRMVSANRAKRPNSYVMEETADLNQLAHEMTSDDAHTPEVKLVTRIRHRDLTSSAKVGVASSNHTPSGNLRSKTLSMSSERLHGTSSGRGTKYNFQQKMTPEPSGGSTRNQLVSSWGSRNEKLHPRGTLNSRSSTPSSGRSTPGSSTVGERRVRVSPTNELTTPAGGLTRLPGPRLRSTQKRIARVREVRPVGNIPYHTPRHPLK